MNYKNWKILISEIAEKQEEYTTVAKWCNSANDYHIEEDGTYYKVVKNKQLPEPTPNEVILQQIKELEAQITERNIRGAILGDEYAIDRIRQIEAQIDELRHELEEQE